MLSYPLTFRLALVSFGPYSAGGPLATVEDASGETVARAQRADADPGEYRGEDVDVFAVEGERGEEGRQGQLMYRVRPDQMTETGAVYAIVRSDGEALGTLTHDDARSVYRAAFEVEDSEGRPLASVTERRPGLKVLENLPGGPLGVLTALLVNPTYEIETPDGRLARLKKRPSLLEGKFVLEEPEGGGFFEAEEAVLFPVAIMVVVLERQRG